MSCDLECFCDDCGSEIDVGEATYCEACRDGGDSLNKDIPREECGRCRRTFNRTAMIAKIAGTMCWECAHAHEMELLKSLTEGELNGQAPRQTGSAAQAATEETT